MGSFFADPGVQEQLQILASTLLPDIWETAYSTVLSTLFAYVIGLPLGVLLVIGERDGIHPLPAPFMKALNFVINILRSVPFLILMILAIPISRFIVGTSVGTPALIPPLVIAAFPFVARLVEGSLREMDRGIVEAAQAMGCTTFQLIWKVMLPECMPSLLTGFTTAFITILSYGAMAGILGGGGLGATAINYGYYRKRYLVEYVAVIVLVVLVQIFQSAGSRLATRCDRRQNQARGARIKGVAGGGTPGGGPEK